MIKKGFGVDTSSQKNAGKIICQNKQCSSLGAYQLKTNFYLTRNPQFPIYPICKNCIKESISLDNMETVYNTLKILNFPFLPAIWKKCVQDNPEDFFDKYIDAINDKKYIDLCWEDSNVPEQEEKKEDGVPVWDKDWQGVYTREDLEYLNNYLYELREQFDITNVNYTDYAKKIANASLMETKARNNYQMAQTKENFAIWKDANAMFDTLSKSAKFSENTRTSNDVGLGSFGQIFDAVEKHNYVPKKVPDDKDMYDKLLEQFSNVEKSL